MENISKELQLEAESYAKQYDYVEDSDAFTSFIAGATSKYVEKEKLQFTIEQFKNLTEKIGGYSFKNVNERLEWLEQQLRQLENV